MDMLARIPALAVGEALCAPLPGWFRCTLTNERVVAPDDVIGELEVLGRIRLITVPAVRGSAQHDAALGERRAVSYGDVLLRVVASDSAPALANRSSDDAAGNAESRAARAASGLVFRAPTSGRFYARSSPDKPPFVSAGVELTPGSTICLLEVMKTFHRVTYAGVPARVREVLVADGDDVTAGTALLELEAL